MLEEEPLVEVEADVREELARSLTGDQVCKIHIFLIQCSNGCFEFCDTVFHMVGAVGEGCL